MSGLPSSPLDKLHFPTEHVIIKSSDGIEFKAYKNLLALASPFFGKMFSSSIPAEPKIGEPSAITTEDLSGVQIVELTELGPTVDYLMRLVYPIPLPAFPGLSVSGDVEDAEELMKALDPVLDAALKYSMHPVVEKLCGLLLNAAEATHPDGRVVHETLAVRIFTFACQFRLKDVARRAAHASLKGRIWGVFFDDFRRMNGAQYFALADFHRKIVNDLRRTVSSEGVSVVYPYLKCTDCGCSIGYVDNIAAWWFNWLERANPILIESPLSEEVFSEGFLRDMYAKAERCSSWQCKQLSVRWASASALIKESINESIEKHDIDLNLV